MSDHAAMATHIEWLHKCLREAGMCIDGGRCHHDCNSLRQPKPCFRSEGCVPLIGSALNDSWTLPGAQAADDWHPDHRTLEVLGSALRKISPEAVAHIIQAFERHKAANDSFEALVALLRVKP